MFDYVVHKIERDGNCMFRAITLSMYGTEENHSIVWSRIVKQVVNNWNLYHAFVVGNTSHDTPIINENYYSKIMSKNRTQSGHLELNAETIIFNIFITIFHQNDGSVTQLGINADGEKW